MSRNRRFWNMAGIMFLLIRLIRQQSWSAAACYWYIHIYIYIYTCFYLLDKEDVMYSAPTPACQTFRTLLRPLTPLWTLPNPGRTKGQAPNVELNPNCIPKGAPSSIHFRLLVKPTLGPHGKFKPFLTCFEALECPSVWFDRQCRKLTKLNHWGTI